MEKTVENAKILPQYSKRAAFRLRGINSIARAFSSAITPDEILSQMVELVARELDADLVSVMIKEGEYLKIRAATGLPQWIMEEAKIKVGEGISGIVAKSGQPLLVKNMDKYLVANPQLNRDFVDIQDNLSLISPRDKNAGIKDEKSGASGKKPGSTDEKPKINQKDQRYKGKSFISMPIKSMDRTIGILNVNSSKAKRKFNKGDLDFLEIISSHAALALERSERYEIQLKSREMEKEFELATMIQESFLPDPQLKFDGITIFARLLPAKQLSGDFYDYFQLNDGRLVFVIGDVSGKGISSALFMAKVISDMQSFIRFHGDISPAIQELNKTILKRSRRGMFVTLSIFILDKNRGLLQYFNAGHSPTILKGIKGDIRELLANSIPLGIMGEIKVTLEEILLKEGDILILYTDGIIEARSPKGQEYGRKGLVKTISEGLYKADLLGEKIMSSVTEHISQGLLHDDITLLLLGF